MKRGERRIAAVKRSAARIATFVLEPALGFKESNALYQRELPTWMESAQSLGLDPV